MFSDIISLEKDTGGLERVELQFGDTAELKWTEERTNNLNSESLLRQILQMEALVWTLQSNAAANLCTQYIHCALFPH